MKFIYNKNLIKKYVLSSIFIIFLSLIYSTSWAVNITATVDRNVISEGEEIELIIKADETIPEPTLNELQNDFIISSVSNSREIRVVNGVAKHFSEFRFLLIPKSHGKVIIPALNINGTATTPISITVNTINTITDPNNISDPTTSPDVFIETKYETKTPYVQQNVGITVRLHYAVPLASGSLDFRTPKNARLEKAGSDTSTEAEVNGKKYTVNESYYLLTPEQSGALIVPEIRFSGLLQQQQNTPSRRNINIIAPSETLDVQPQPVAMTPWLPLKDLRLRYVTTPMKAKAGEATEIVIEAVAEGATQLQFNDIPVLTIPNAQVFAEPAQFDQKQVNGQTKVIVTRKYSIIPDKDGVLTIPGLKMDWWDVVNNTQQVAELPDMDWTILPGKNIIPTANSNIDPNLSTSTKDMTNAVTENNNSIYMKIGFSLAVLFGILWIVTLLWVFKTRPNTAPLLQKIITKKPIELPKKNLLDLANAFQQLNIDLIISTLCEMHAPTLADTDALLNQLADSKQRNAVNFARESIWRDEADDVDKTAIINELKNAFSKGPQWRPVINTSSEIDVIPPLYPKHTANQ